jgi:glutathione synthase/RimK-type ligase-like ATP-grasp enzyme
MTDVITIVTHVGAPDGVADDHRLAEAIAALGGEAQYAVWTDASMDWSSGAVTIVRSAWDYHLHPTAWFQWLDRVAPLTRLVNAVDLIRWNSEKTYLLNLSERGVPIVPTVLLSQSSNLLKACVDRGWSDVVVKPTIGASTFGVRRFLGPEIAIAGIKHVERLLTGGKALLQPYQGAIEDARERSLVYIDGLFSHAFSKPGFHAGIGDADLPSYTPTSEELDLSRVVLSTLPQRPVFARIDMVPSTNGPLLMEAELVEPLLAFQHSDSAAHKLAAALIGAGTR